MLYPADERQHSISNANKVIELMISHYECLFEQIPIDAYQDGNDRPPEKNEAIRAFEGRLLKRRSQSTTTLPKFYFYLCLYVYVQFSVRELQVRSRSNSVADTPPALVQEFNEDKQGSKDKEKKAKSLQRRDSEFIG